MKPTFYALLLPGLFALAGIRQSDGEDRYRPGDPFAAIDGNAIYLGELNLILAERLKVRDLDRVEIDVKRATAALVVRRHLALASLRQQGGASLESIINRQIDEFAAEAKRRGSSLADQAKSRLSDETSLKADISWRAAWAQYLRSQLNEKNLRRYFEREKDRYAGGRWQVSQIFVDMDPKDAASVAIATERMAALADQLRAESDVEAAFAQAARDHSDAGSAPEGGMVGWVERDGDMPTAVMEAVRGTAPGQISKPIRSPLGMHLVYVHQKEPGTGTFDQLTDQGQLRRDATNALFDALVRRQADAKIVWFITALKPPANIPIIPK